ncbi:MAG: hypothetical protein WAV51_01905 [Microgenomates group bacterium]
MNPQTLKDSLGWGFLLWLIGYILGIVLFMIVPAHMIGWVLSPAATLFTLWVLIRKINSRKFLYYLILGVVWTVIAIVFDYVFIVQLFQSANYYKLDVYVYYALMLILPMLVGWRKMKK